MKPKTACKTDQCAGRVVPGIIFKRGYCWQCKEQRTARRSKFIRGGCGGLSFILVALSGASLFIRPDQPILAVYLVLLGIFLELSDRHAR